MVLNYFGFVKSLTLLLEMTNFGLKFLIWFLGLKIFLNSFADIFYLNKIFNNLLQN